MLQLAYIIYSNRPQRHLLEFVLKLNHRHSGNQTMAIQSLYRLSYTEKYVRFLSFGKVETHLHENERSPSMV